MTTKCQFEVRLNDWLILRNMPVVVFAEVVKLDGIAGASQARLFAALRDGGKSLPNEVVERLEPLMSEIEAMCKAVEPFALDLTDAAKTYEWLQARRAGGLHVAVRYDGAVKNGAEGIPVIDCGTF